MVSRTFRIPVEGSGEVSAVVTRPEDCRPGSTPGLVLAHGQNNDLSHPLLVSLAESLAQTGTASTLRFNFPYAERKVKSPDRIEVLELTYRRAHDVLVDDEICPPGPVFLGGKSLGARVAAELVSRGHEGEGLLATGLVFLGYPLHGPGKARIRKEPLRRIDVPSLFVEGSRDPFCDLELLEPLLTKLDLPGELLVIEGGGHSFEPRRGSELSLEGTYAKVAEGVSRFISAHSNGSGS